MEPPVAALSARSGRRVPHRRSKSQRDRQRGHSPANSSSSISPGPVPRPLRKKKLRHRWEKAGQREEDLIDGFCINSYGSLEAMQRDTSLYSAPSEEPQAKRPSGKRKRNNVSSDNLVASSSGNKASAQRGQRLHGAHTEQCDAESSCNEQPSMDDLGLSFTISADTGSLSLSGGRIKLSIHSHVSGLQRSCEKNPDLDNKPPLIVPEQHPSPAPPCTPCPPPQTPHSPSPKPQPLPASAPSTDRPDRSRISKSLSVPQISPHPLTPPAMGHSGEQSFPSALRPPSHQLGLFAASPVLPPPPPLRQATGHPASTVTAVLSQHNVIGQDMGTRFMPVQSSNAELSATIRPMFQFHQHNHQHMHQHTHQHFTPYPPSMGPTTFEKYPGKIDSLYRQNFFSPFSALPSVLPPSVSFGSLQGAFQPKSTSSELASRCSVPSSMSHKPPQLTEQLRPRKSGRWCAMHVRVAYMILRHQERLKFANGTPHKSEFRSDALTCLPAGYNSLPSPHELARPPSLISGVMSHSAGHFQISPASASFLQNGGPVGNLIRASGFSPLTALANGAFGGLGNSPYNPTAVFNPKDHPAVQAFPNPHEAWNRLHRTPPSFPTLPPQVCAKAGDLEKHSSIHLKEEKDRELLYNHLPPSKRLLGAEEYGISPFVGVRPGSSSEIKHRQTPEQPIKVKEEAEVLTFEVRRSPVPGLHLPHTHPAAQFERQRNCFLRERFPHMLEAWRDVYRRADPPPLRIPAAPPHRLYEPCEERAHILRENFERARIYGMSAASALDPPTSSMLNTLYSHSANSLLSKTPPVNLLSAPPPLISTSRPGSPHCRDLSSLYKEREPR
ncbi:probable fibrosin-1 isoform X2 [Bombina bombina]|uniref:probable fibrosin-1 isoform X2 n=1 Tax=Bombina bombina TaxID=8345 RepID=UPI00235A6DE7|nr:probable fibrosin-1 isoform X2 [Bombina bombina]